MRIIDRLRIFLILITVQIRNIGFQLMRLRLGKNFLLLHPIIINTEKKEKTFIKYGELGKIVIDRNYELIDGYCSYLICKKYDIGKAPVWFE